MRDFRTLTVWQKAHAVALRVSQISKSFPRGERYGLTTQINRAATSISTNLAEGCGSTTDAEFAQFVRVAARSASELEYQILLAHDLNLLPDKPYETLLADVTQVRRMLTALLKKLNVARKVEQ